MNYIFTISNNISIFRILISFPLIYFLWEHNVTAVLIISALAFASDYLDGYFARKRGEITDFGKILDPLADKIFFGTAAIIMIIQGLIPLYLAIIIVGRDILIFLGGIYIKQKKGIVVASNMAGKVAVNVAALALIGIFLGWKGFYTYGSLITAIFFGYSFLTYVFTAYKILKK